MNTRLQTRGMSLVEVLVAMAILTVSGMGLLGGMVIASKGTGLASQRTEMANFARARIERLAATTRSKIPTSTTTLADSARYCCTNMAAATTPFDPDKVAPGTGGWVLDLIDGASPAGAGEDMLAGPLMVASSVSNTIADTLAVRSALAASWTGATDGTKGCADPIVTGQTNQTGWPAATSRYCRELHVEPCYLVSTGKCDPPPAPAGTVVPMLHIWVRVIQGGYNPTGSTPGAWKNSYLVMEELVSQ